MAADRTHERNRAGGGRLESVSGPLLVRRFSVRQPEMFRVIEKVCAGRLTSLDKASLCELAQTVIDLEYEGLDGDILAVGRGCGGAAVVLAEAKRRSRTFIAHELNGDEPVLSGGPLALAHLGPGSAGSMGVLLERLAPRLASGGRLIIDEYRTRQECRRAVDDYFRGKKGYRLVRKSRLHIIRN